MFFDQINQPVAELIFGGIQSCLQKTPHATASLAGDLSGLQLVIDMPHQSDWVPEARDYYFGSEGAGRARALPDLPETLFALSTYRNFSEMWLRAGDLFNADVNDGIAQADANLTTLFAGRDFGEDILGSFEPEVGFIAVRQDFDAHVANSHHQAARICGDFRIARSRDDDARAAANVSKSGRIPQRCRCDERTASTGARKRNRWLIVVNW